ncbi:ATP-binding protein [Sphaerothrix gracilis]|uniref:ATP-binding protein n=1 Tax=Sphaerothrix gracilis TaxID=3151835 RepID=UPI0031FC5E1B
MKLISRKLNRLTNKYLRLLLTAAVVLSLMLVALGSWNVWNISRNFENIIATEFRLQQTSSKIIHLDEVLTMSARMAAATGDSTWETRYRRFEPQLDTAIKQAIQLAPETYANHAVQTDAANAKLVNMENRAFKLVDQGQPDRALALLLSDTYTNQKEIYADGMNQTIDTLQTRIRLNLETYSSELSQSSLFSIVSFSILMSAWLTILVLVNQYVRQRNQAEKRLHIAKTELEHTNKSLETSQVVLRQKTQILAASLQELQETQLKMIQAEKMSSLGQLVAGVAHEINNPVNFIHGNLSCLRTYIEDLLDLIQLYQNKSCFSEPEIRSKAISIDLIFLQQDLPKMLDSMKLGTERIQQIVLSLRNFSRMDEAAFKAVDIHEGIESTLLLLGHRLKHKANFSEIEVITDYKTIPEVECYPGQLNQVLMNILTNAIDALEDVQTNQIAKHSQITIRTSCIVRNGAEWIKISIIDNGCGIPEEIQKRIFDPFFTTKPVGKGTGMGMSISYQIITEKHGGKLECFSRIGYGTEFVIQIPVKQAKPSKGVDKLNGYSLITHLS